MSSVLFTACPFLRRYELEEAGRDDCRAGEASDLSPVPSPPSTPSLLLLSLDTAAARSVLCCMASESVTLGAKKCPPTFSQALVVRPHLLPPTARRADLKIVSSCTQGGAVAGMSVDLLFFPIDTIKTRLQSQQGFIQSGGFRGVYKGIGSVFVGGAPGGTLRPRPYRSDAL